MPNTPGIVLYPTSLDDADSLIRAANNAATTLTSSVVIGATTLTVASTASFASSGMVTIDGEVISYTGKTSTTFTGCANPTSGVTAAHSAGANVETLVAAIFHNTLSSAVRVVEAKLGIGATTADNGYVLQGTGVDVPTGAGITAWKKDIYIGGTLGVGVAPSPASIGLDIARNNTSSALASGTSYYFGQRNFSTINLTSNSVSGWRAYAVWDWIRNLSNYDAESVYGQRLQVSHEGTGTINNQTAAQLSVIGSQASGTGTTNNLSVAELAMGKTGAGVWNVGTLKTLNILAPTMGTLSTLVGTSVYGMYMGDFGNPGGAWTNKYALYITGGTSYHAGNFGIGVNAPNSPLQVAGAVSTAIATKSANYTLAATDSVILVNALSAVITITLPTAVGIAGRKYTVVKVDASSPAHAVTLQAAASQTISGSSSMSLGAQWNTISVVSDGVNWVVV